MKDTVAKRGSGLSMLAAAAFSKKGNDVKMSKREDEIRQEAEAEAFKKVCNPNLNSNHDPELSQRQPQQPLQRCKQCERALRC